MRRFQACVFVLLGAVLLLAPAQALASMGAGRAVAPAAKGAAAAGVDFKRLGATTTYPTTTYPISGSVLDYAGDPVSDAVVGWGWWSSVSAYHFGGDNSQPYGTPSTGAFAFPGVTGGHQWGGNPADDLRVYYYPETAGLELMEAEQLDFATNNDKSTIPYSYKMQPAQVNVDISHAPAAPYVEVVAGDGQVGYAYADVPLTSGEGVASVLPMTNFDDVVAFLLTGYGGSTAETESVGLPPVAVAAGTTAADTVDLDWANAQHAYLAGPLCRHSGKPGTMVTMTLKGWPAGETASFVGYYGASSDPYPQTQTSSGASDTYNVPLQISPKAPADLYDIGTYRLDDPHSLISLQDFFQVCTFKSSTSWLHRGRALRLSGVVPVPGSGYVAIYSTRHKVSGQPLTLAAKGWVRGARYRVSASGKFLSGALYPTRTTWYVAKYTGTDFPAFTSVVKVNVY
jgi:hypothetical protein